MKVSVKQYAESLYDLTYGKEKSQIDLIAKKFSELLSESGQLKVAGRIIEKFSEIYNRENGIIEAEVTSREELCSELRNYVSNYVSNKYKAKEVVLKNKIDERIKGGVIIKVGDEIFDASVAGKLNDLRSVLTN